jgi:hypothetical protein
VIYVQFDFSQTRVVRFDSLCSWHSVNMVSLYDIVFSVYRWGPIQAACNSLDSICLLLVFLLDVYLIRWWPSGGIKGLIVTACSVICFIPILVGLVTALSNLRRRSQRTLPLPVRVAFAVLIVHICMVGMSLCRHALVEWTHATWYRFVY